MNLTYLGLLLATIAFPLVFSRSERFGFGARWKWAWAAVLSAAVPFAVWDMVFTRLQVWAFNPEYVLGVYLCNLPLEEALFFVAIPFSCLFIYQCLGEKADTLISSAWAARIWGLLLLVFASVPFLAHASFAGPKAYTATVTTLAACASLAMALTRPRYSGRLLIAILIQYLPFAIVNGALTALPVVRYDDSRILGIRLGTIPVEDCVYSLILLVLPVALYEFLSGRFPARRIDP